jgi:hypothetical protein
MKGANGKPVAASLLSEGADGAWHITAQANDRPWRQSYTN